MDIIKLRRGSGKAATKRMGPNDANRVVWATGTCFFFLSCFFFNSFLSTRNLGATVLRMDTEEATTRRMGPNDAKRVVWAISKCFFLFFVCFFFLFKIIYLGSIDNVEYGWIHGRLRRGKRAQTTRTASFGLLVRVFFFSFRVFYFTNLYLQVL